MRHSGKYPLCARGKINTYSIFTECMRQILHPRGRIGCIVPSGIATDDTTKVFFQDLMDSRTLVSLYDFENPNKIFPAVHRSKKFSLLTLSGTERPAMQGARFAFFLHDPTELKTEERAFVLTAEEIALLNPNTRTCPIFRSQRDAELTKQLYKRVPIFIREDGKEMLNLWSATLSTMFNMASDSHLFHTYTQLQQDGWTLRGNIFYRGNEKCYPLYEGKMISHYDHRFGGYTTTAEGAEQGIDRRDPFAVPLPRYWIHERDMNADVLREQTALLAFRDIARSTDVRTAIFSIIPAVACNHKTPLLYVKPKDPFALLLLASHFSSFVFDYVARQKVGGTSMGFFILKQLPVLPPETYKQECVWQPGVSLGEWILPRALELTYTAWDLEAFARECGYAGPPFRWDEERRFLLRCELDAAFFHLYGVAREDVAFIMETFPLVKKEDEKRNGEYRSRRVILEIYDALQEASEQGAMYQTRLEPPPADPSVAHPLRS
ncbi:Eco57I restriction-modification methylase domain-containing protein [Thermosporothrix hazakensis]